MFSGIIQEVGTICFLQPQEGHVVLGIQGTLKFLDRVIEGGSVAVDGVCLTMTRKERSIMFFDVIPETLACTTLQKCFLGDRVNLENALRFGDPVGGHMVSGHVCGTGEIISIRGNRYEFQVSAYLAPYLFDKGFIAIDGISLTLASVKETEFSVGVIPETLQRTSLGYKSVNSLVNIEVDMSTKVQVDTLQRLAVCR